jgi:hypothetical protein
VRIHHGNLAGRRQRPQGELTASRGDRVPFFNGLIVLEAPEDLPSLTPDA